MKQIIPAYSTAVLCGGGSRRMKTDKALIDWNGQPLALYIASGFSSCDDVFLSVRSEDQFDLPGIRMFPDEYTGCGPMAGLAASLENAKHDILFITTCDAPLVNKNTADVLVSMLGEYDAVVPRSADHIHPLIAVYRRSVLQGIKKALSEGTLKITRFLKELDVNYVDAGLLPYGEDTLTNLNTPEELEAFTINLT